MSRDIQKMVVGLRSEYRITGLQVPVILAGQVHDFQHNGRRIKISIPRNYYNSQAKKNRNVDLREYAAAASWRMVTRSNSEYYRTTQLFIHRVFVFVELNPNDRISVNEETIGLGDRNETRIHFHKINGEKKINQLGTQLAACADDAFRYWCRVVRWETNHWFIGMPKTTDAASNAYRYFATNDPLRYLCNLPISITAIIGEGITTHAWRQAEQALKSQIEPPVWFDILCEARNKHLVGNYREAVINAAISAETLLRRRAFEAVSSLKTTDPAIVKLVDKWPLQSLLGNLEKISTTKKHKLTKTQISRLHDLFDKRNDIMHKGEMLVDQAASERAIDTVEAMHELI